MSIETNLLPIKHFCLDIQKKITAEQRFSKKHVKVAVVLWWEQVPTGAVL